MFNQGGGGHLFDIMTKGMDAYQYLGEGREGHILKHGH